MGRLTTRIRQIADIAEKLPTGLVDGKATEKMDRELSELQAAIEEGDRLGTLMEAGDVAYYAIKAWYNEAVGLAGLILTIRLAADTVNIPEDVLLDICIAKLSLRALPGNPKDDKAEREAVIKVLEEAGHA